MWQFRGCASRPVVSCSTCTSRLDNTTSWSSRKCQTRRLHRSSHLWPLEAEASRIRSPRKPSRRQKRRLCSSVLEKLPGPTSRWERRKDETIVLTMTSWSEGQGGRLRSRPSSFTNLFVLSDTTTIAFSLIIGAAHDPSGNPIRQKRQHPHRLPSRRQRAARSRLCSRLSHQPGTALGDARVGAPLLMPRRFFPAHFVR